MKRFIAIFILSIAMLIFITACKHEHSFSAWNTVDEPSCLAAGIEERICECGYKEMRRVDPLSHTRVLDEAVEPTCTESGLTAGMHCSECGTIIVAQSIVSQLTHQYSSSTDIDCNICGERRVVDCKHTETVAIIGMAATCTATGLTNGTKCKQCGEILVAQQLTPIVAHIYDDKYDETCNECDFVRDVEGTQSGSTEYTPGVVYDISPDGTCAEVIAYEGTANDIVIASEYNGLPVRKIYGYVFENNYSITSIVIPDTVIGIENSTFSCCINLSNVVMGNGIEYIDEFAFHYCISLTSITIGDSVTQVADSAFYDCENLSNVYLGNNIQKIGQGAFSGCDFLNFTIYENCKYLGSETNPYMVLMQTEKSNFSTYKIHNDTKVIADRAFYYCSRLSNIVIPDKVTSIGIEAFSGCQYLTNIFIPQSVEYIGRFAFSFCPSVIIKCEVASKPIGWDENWQYYYGTVIWGEPKPKK